MKPDQFQEDAADFIYARDASIVCAKTGTGKTLCNLLAMKDWIGEGVSERIMVTAPLRVAKYVWQQESEKWRIPLRMGLMTGGIQTYDPSIHNVMLTNFEMIPKLADMDHGCDTLVIDELSRLRNPTGTWQKAIRKAPFKIRTGATGTPAPNGLTSVYGMCRALGLDHLVGRNYDKWLRTHFYPLDFEQYDWAPFRDTLPKLADMLKPYSYVLENDAVKLPDIVRLPMMPMPLPKELREVYDRLRKKSVLTDLEIVVGSAGVLRNKLRQIASGFIYGNDKKSHSLSPYRLNWMADIVKQQKGEPIILVYEYREQLAMLRARWPKAPWLGYQSENEEHTIAQWNMRRIPVMFLHPQSAGHGLNLQFGGNTIAWWAIPDDFELYEQVLARLARRGQRDSFVTSYEPVATNTIEETVKTVAHMKDMTQQGLWQALRA
jgi:hypothetical protein